ncbi:FbpB family small basic protein [Mangrovibacillus cuniculi]|uniref:FbpB family small basic protein n=1 Tax=Mangrovibacillus cuniculi TaxID=2593652 RepID=A0A7S8CAL8_9BACI|nr:FbpB family small basic protein [Mangrovibacillus cuniculi]QPC46464.1 FbpB family small basic protein [Mangrovibacillus cuniculi]
MKRIRKRSFADLVKENRQALLRDAQAMERLEDRIDSRHQAKI